MNDRIHPTIAQALSPFAPQQRVSTPDLCTAIRRWTRSNPDHRELITVLFELVTTVKKNGSLSDVCRAYVADQILNSVGDIEQDLCNQRAKL